MLYSILTEKIKTRLNYTPLRNHPRLVLCHIHQLLHEVIADEKDKY